MEERQVTITPQTKRPHRKKHKKKSSTHIARAIVLIILIFAISVGLASVIIHYGRDMLGIRSGSETIVVTVDRGANVDDIARLLKKNDIINDPNFFKLFIKMSKNPANFKAGDHEVRPNMAYETLINALSSDPIGDKNAVKITFPEGVTLSEAAAKLEVEEVCKADEFLQVFNSEPKYGLKYESHMPTFSNNKKFYKMEGYLFPDTYEFYKNMAPDLVARRILENFDSKITDQMYDEMKQKDITLDDTITFASLVQMEVSSTKDMKKVASVFWNRLNNSTQFPRLQSDTTYKYIDNVIKPNSGDNLNEDIINAYDTYTCTGLPAGAIGSPGLDAIDAVLNPDTTHYYYFISDTDTGKTYFSENYDEHESIQESIQNGGEETEPSLEFNESEPTYVAGQNGDIVGGTTPTTTRGW